MVCHCYFHFPHFILFFFLMKKERKSLPIINVILQYHIFLYAGSCSFSLELVFHLVTTSSLSDFWGQK